MNRSSSRRLHIPIRFVEGRWEFALGGVVPVMEGAEAELAIEPRLIHDKSFVAAMTQKESFRVLEEGASLLVGLTIKSEKPTPPELKKHLIGYDLVRSLTPNGLIDRTCCDTRFDQITHFVEVKIAGPDSKQMRLFETDSGGLWLMAEGFKATGLASTTVKLPDEVSVEPASSLNHALTQLSETYETWRISHTGNIYTRVFYQERNGKWYPLDALRNEALDKKEQHIAKEIWDAFVARMSPAAESSRRR